MNRLIAFIRYRRNDDAGAASSQSEFGGSDAGAAGPTGTAYEFHARDTEGVAEGEGQASVAPSPELARQQRLSKPGTAPLFDEISSPHRPGDPAAAGEVGDELNQRFVEMLQAGDDLDNTPPMPGNRDDVPPAPNQG